MRRFLLLLATASMALPPCVAHAADAFACKADAGKLAIGAAGA